MLRFILSARAARAGYFSWLLTALLICRAFGGAAQAVPREGPELPDFGHLDPSVIYTRPQYYQELRLVSDQGRYVGLFDYVQRQLRYPLDAFAARKEGEVLLQIRIDTLGYAHDPIIVKPLSPSCDAEALRLARHLPPIDLDYLLRRRRRARFYQMLPVRFVLPVAARNGMVAYDFADLPPVFPGGSDSLAYWVRQRTRQPKTAKGQRPTTGTVEVEFIVDGIGRPTRPVVTRSLSAGADAEALRLVRGLPRYLAPRERERTGPPYQPNPVYQQLTVTFPAGRPPVVPGRVYEREQVDAAPRLRGQPLELVLPGFVADAQSAALIMVAGVGDQFGALRVQVVIDSTGRSRDAKVLHRPGEDPRLRHPEREDQALQIAQMMRCQPAKLRGRPVAVRFVVAVPFLGKVLPPGDYVYEYAEQMPEFPGGQAALLAALLRNVRLPAAASCPGTVFIRFVVNRAGKAVKPVVAKSLSSVCDAAVLRAVDGLPAFKPGKQNGAPVQVRYSVPVKLDGQ